MRDSKVTIYLAFFVFVKIRKVFDVLMEQTSVIRETTRLNWLLCNEHSFQEFITNLEGTNVYLGHAFLNTRR